MNRIGRGSINSLTLVSLLLCLTTTAMWVRSHWRHDEFQLYGNPTLVSDSGSIRIGRWETFTAPSPASRPTNSFRGLTVQQPPPASLTVMIQPFQIYYVSVVFWFGMLPFLWILAWAIKREAGRRRGCCRHCGYDLRATPQRCPECGMAADE